MHLTGRQSSDLQCVANRPGVVRPCARVQQDPLGGIAEGVQVLDELALEVALKEADLRPSASANSAICARAQPA